MKSFKGRLNAADFGSIRVSPADHPLFQPARGAKEMTPVEIGPEQPNANKMPRFAQNSGAFGKVSESILCVDDDPNILAAFERQFRKTFTIETAAGPEEGLATISKKGPFAVVVSDLRMPGMSGVQFLATVRARWPDTVRIMLTGQADMADAIAAVNQGAIFRFLLKPSSTVILGKVIELALEQHRLIVAERQLTQQTLVGCVEVLCDVLSIVEPVAFSRTTGVLRYVRQLTGILKLTSSWEVEAAAMLSQIGCITIPDIANKLSANLPLSSEESRRYHEHPAAAARIIQRIPRLQAVAKIIEAQAAPLGPTFKPDSSEDLVRLGASILHGALDFDERRRGGLSPGDAVADMRSGTDYYDPNVLSALARLEELELADQTKLVRVTHLSPGMILEQDICAQNGVCIVGRGIQITATMLERVQGFWHTMDTELMISVRIPEAESVTMEGGGKT
jgi:response regulator RpfG family c-di-GMP phosphodiesterase